MRLKHVAAVLLLCLAAAGTASAQNNPPTIVVSSGANPLANNETVSVAINTDVSDLMLSIDVDDPEMDPVALTMNVTNLTSQGLVSGEWNSATANTPYSLTPTTGNFDVGNIAHVIELGADDGVNVTIFRLIVVVGAMAGNSSPVITFVGGDEQLGPGDVVTADFDTMIADAGVAIIVSDYDGDNVSLDFTITNMTTQGIVSSEWTSAAAAAPYELNPTSGQFNVAGAAHVITLTANDGTTSVVMYFIVLVGPDGVANVAPFIGLFSGSTYIGDGTTVNVAYNSSVANLNLRLVVADFDGDIVSSSLDGVTNLTSQGLVVAEWEGSTQAPFELVITSGSFNVASVNHVVTLSADDGTDMSGFSFTIAVGPDTTPPPPAGDDDDDDDDGCSTGSGEGLSWLMMAALASIGVLAFRRRTA